MKETILQWLCAKRVSAPVVSASVIELVDRDNPTSFGGTVKARRITGAAFVFSGVEGAVAVSMLK